MKKFDPNLILKTVNIASELQEYNEFYVRRDQLEVQCGSRVLANNEFVVAKEYEMFHPSFNHVTHPCDDYKLSSEDFEKYKKLLEAECKKWGLIAFGGEKIREKRDQLADDLIENCLAILKHYSPEKITEEILRKIEKYEETGDGRIDLAEALYFLTKDRELGLKFFY